MMWEVGIVRSYELVVMSYDIDERKKRYRLSKRNGSVVMFVRLSEF